MDKCSRSKLELQIIPGDKWNDDKLQTGWLIDLGKKQYKARNDEPG